MNCITLSAAGWTHIDEFYGAILNALEAPEWHGHNVNALIDSMVYGQINGLSPPYKIIISESGQLKQSLRDQIAAQLFYIMQATDEAPFVTKPDIKFTME